MTSIVQLLSTHPFLEGLPRDHIESIAECASETEFEPGAYIFHEGDEATHFFLIRSGEVALSTTSPASQAETFETLSDCDFIGITWLTPPFRLIFDAVAQSKVEAIAFNATCLRTKCDDDHDLGYALMQLFVPALVERTKSARIKALDLYKAS